jgi:hypothetical protein
VIHVTAALLDLTNLVGGFLLAAALLTELPRVGPGMARVAGATARVTVAVGVLALASGGYYLILHLTAGPHVFHFELIGIGIGVATLRDRLFPGRGSGTGTGTDSSSAPSTAISATDTAISAPDTAISATSTATSAPGTVTGSRLLLAVFGLIAMGVGLQGLLTPDG